MAITPQSQVDMVAATDILVRASRIHHLLSAAAHADAYEQEIIASNDGTPRGEMRATAFVAAHRLRQHDRQDATNALYLLIQAANEMLIGMGSEKAIPAVRKLRRTAGPLPAA